MENFATEFMTKLDGKLTPEQMKTVLMELEMFSANFDIEKKNHRNRAVSRLHTGVLQGVSGIEKD